MKRASGAAAARATTRLIAVKKSESPIRRLQKWAKADKDRYFEIRYIARAKHPWAVQLSNDAVSWSVTADTHDSLDRAVDHALADAAKEEAVRRDANQ